MDQGHARTLLDESVGQRVFLQYMGARAPSDEHLAVLAKDPDKILHSQPRVLSVYVLLESYDQYGITIQTLSEDRLRSFVPWGALLYLYKVEDGPEDAV
jgi:hypothetical protein